MRGRRVVPHAACPKPWKRKSARFRVTTGTAANRPEKRRKLDCLGEEKVGALTRLAQLQACFAQVEFVLDFAKNFIVDATLVAQSYGCFSLHAQKLAQDLSISRQFPISHAALFAILFIHA